MLFLNFVGSFLSFTGSNEPPPHSEKYVSSLLYIGREARRRAARDANAIAQFEEYICELRF